MRWFRFYEEVLNDPKVQSLPPELFKFWINVLCVASICNGKIPLHETLEFHLRMLQKPLQENLKKLIEAGLLEEKNGNLIPHNWPKRQYKSDSSTPRVQKYRAKKKAVTETLHVTFQDRFTDRYRNAPETETYTETDIKKEKQEKEKKAAPFLSGKPDDAFFLDEKKSQRLREQAERREQAIEVLNFLNEKVEKRYRPVEANLKPIEARLASGVSKQQCMKVIAFKAREWLFNADMKKHLNPETLFRPAKFEKYLGQLGVTKEEGDGDVR